MKGNAQSHSDRATRKDGKIKTALPVNSGLHTDVNKLTAANSKEHRMNTNDTTAKLALDRFLADNPELEELSARLSTFNVFRALNIEHQEIRHSNVLAWLLDPKESHGLGDIVLRRILSNMLLEACDRFDGVSAAQVELMDFTDVEVRREWKHIDLLMVDRTNRLIVLVENKIHSEESPRQLVNYHRKVEQEFPEFTVVPVFLTLTGQESHEKEAKEYIPYSHIQLLTVLERLYEQRKSQLSESVAMFLSHYMGTLRMLTMQDEKLIELCKTIYRRHRQAIDLIVEYGTRSIVQQIVEDTLLKEGRYVILHSRPSYLCFLPQSWTKILPKNRDASVDFGYVWDDSRRFAVKCEFDVYPGKLYFFFEVTRMEDKSTRTQCIDQLSKAGFKLNKKAFSDDAIYSRFYSETLPLKDMTDATAVREGVENLLQKAQDRFVLAEKVFKEVFGTSQK